MVLSMGKAKLKKVLKEMDCASEQEAWKLGEKLIDDDVGRIEALGDQFPDGIPRLRTTDKLLMLHPGGDEGILFFENTRGNRRQLIRQILDQLPEGGGEDDEEGLDDADVVFVDHEPDYDADPDRPVETGKTGKHRYL